jgi:hypothetical protein
VGSGREMRGFSMKNGQSIIDDRRWKSSNQSLLLPCLFQVDHKVTSVANCHCQSILLVLIQCLHVPPSPPTLLVYIFRPMALAPSDR